VFPPSARSGVSGGAPVLDTVDLMRRVEGDETLLSDLARTFLATAPDQMAAIEAAIERGEGAAIVRAVQTLKGSVSTLGALAAVKAAGRVEMLGDAGDLRGARGARRDLEAEMERLSRALAPYAKGNG
jgi:HPt (histidine-containing phosphotransfer) domain-containing protein